MLYNSGDSVDSKKILDDKYEELEKLFNITISFKGYPKKHEDVHKEIPIEYGELKTIEEKIKQDYVEKAMASKNLPKINLEDIARRLFEILINNYNPVVRDIANQFNSEELNLFSLDYDFQLLLEGLDKTVIKADSVFKKANEEMRELLEVRGELFVDGIIQVTRKHLFNKQSTIKRTLEEYTEILLNYSNYSYILVSTSEKNKNIRNIPVLEVW
ncbi:hypothetical protein [Bacillus toyonensis]|uniref:hypothetical protein n=1 Tax=Bacillus toyonensis TaxID=155322 RepID=UPI0021CE9010|nr:hypothetical protein [Bacillus toyonensis]MCU4771045.1 hypothetical protein [Bacillus toyonensis]